MPRFRLPQTVGSTLKVPLIFTVLGAIVGALISYSAVLLLIVASIVGACYLIITSKLELSRPLAHTLAFALLLTAALMIYFDQPSSGSIRREGTSFSLALPDNQVLTGMRLGRPRVILKAHKAAWSGQVYITGERHDKKGAASQRQLKFIVLLPRSAEHLSGETEPSDACGEVKKEPDLVLECTVPLDEAGAFYLSARFAWRPEMTRLRIGEKLLTLSRADPQLQKIGEPFPKVDKDHPPPLVEVWKDARSIDFRDPHPAVDLSLQNGMAWRMDTADLHQQGYLDVVVVDRRLRFLADQAPNILGIGAGLLLGLLAQPVNEAGARQRQRRQAEAETSDQADVTA